MFDSKVLKDVEFTKDSIKKKTLDKESKVLYDDLVESNRQYGNTFHGRSKEKVLENVIQGLVGEIYLREHHGFQNCTLKYTDVIKDKLIYEVKSYNNPDQKYIDDIIKKLKANKKAGWYKSDYAIIFAIKNGVYKFHSMYTL
jgi:hypothetical protein